MVPFGGRETGGEYNGVCRMAGNVPYLDFRGRYMRIYSNTNDGCDQFMVREIRKVITSSGEKGKLNEVGASRNFFLDNGNALNLDWDELYHHIKLSDLTKTVH